jgi:hypothetical protein
MAVFCSSFISYFTGMLHRFIIIIIIISSSSSSSISISITGSSTGGGGGSSSIIIERSIPGAACGALPEDEQVMLERCRGP